MANNTSNLKAMAFNFPWFSGAHIAASLQGQQVAESYLLASRLRKRLFGTTAMLKTISAEEFGVATATNTETPTTETSDAKTPNEVADTAKDLAHQNNPSATDSTLSLIDNFINSGDHRKIVIADKTTEDSMALFGNENEGEDDYISEELAEIYAKQGLFNDAIEIYRKLSLQDSQKSIYFAELIGQLTKQAAQKEQIKDK